MDEPEALEPATPSLRLEPPQPADSGEPARADLEVVRAVDASPAPTGALGDLVAAHFQRVEIAMLGRILTTTLAGALPASMVRVERRRTLLERLLRRPGQPIGVSVSSADQRLTFRAPDVGITEASVSHVVGGVVLSSRPVPVTDWLAMLAELLNRATNDDDAIRLVLERTLLS